MKLEQLGTASFLRGTLDALKPQCPWCKRNDFPNWSAAKLHVKFCEKAPHPRGKRR